MKSNKLILLVFALLVIAASLYRVWEGRPWGFAPQIAMAIFAGAVIKNKGWAFVIPLLSMFFSDVLYEILYQYGISDIKGFYEGQIINYVLFGGMTLIGFMIKRITIVNVLVAAIAAPTIFFILSNFFLWLGGGLDINSTPYPKTFSGLMNCYTAAIPFYRGSLLATLIFSALFFGVYFLVKKPAVKQNRQLA